MALNDTSSSAGQPSIWKKRTPRLAASALTSDDDSDDDNLMDVSTETRSKSSHEAGETTVEDGHPTAGKSAPVSQAISRRKNVQSLSDDDFRKIVDRIEAMCQKELWGCALREIDELVARRCDERVLEMRAQILIALGRDYDAILSCERSIKLNPLWWEAHHTHGRALLAFGEPRLALKAFQRSLRMNPADEELREELNWTRCNTHGYVPEEGCDFRKLVRRRS